MFQLEIPFKSPEKALNETKSYYSGKLQAGLVGTVSKSNQVTSVSLSKSALVVRTAIGNPIPLFYAWKDADVLVIGDNLARVWNAINETCSKINLDDLDKVALVESSLFDGPLLDRTYLINVKKTQMGEELSIDLKTKKLSRNWRWLPKIQTKQITRTEALERSKYYIKKLASYYNNESNVMIPLTGGLDSRLLAGIAYYESNLNISSYTFQRGWSVETWCAKKVAYTLGASHSVFELPPKECYQDYAKSTVLDTLGMVSGMHTHGIYCCAKKLSKKTTMIPRVFGYFGDPVAGAMTDSLADRSNLRSVEDVFNKYSRSFFPEVVSKYKERIMNDLRESHDLFVSSGSNESVFHEFWKIHQRQNNLITHLFSHHQACQGAKVILPFVDEGFVEFFLGLPYELRLNRNLFKEASKQIYPDLFSLPSMYFSRNSALGRLERFFEVAEGIANRINPRQEKILSPFKYEQHEKTLRNYLFDDVQSGADYYAEIFSVSPRNVKFPVWKFSSSKEYYRLAVLRYLLDK